ncbi:CDGSH iron-sulfur domain-containing protein [Streptomyces sp. NPDC058067]
MEGPVQVVDDAARSSPRPLPFAVAICRCRRSRNHPWCDTSHCLTG